MKKTKTADTRAIVELRLPDDLMATLAHASVLSGQPVDVLINAILAMRIAADKRAPSASGSPNG